MSIGTASAERRRNFLWRAAAAAFAAKIFWLSGETFSGRSSGAFFARLLRAWGIGTSPEAFDLLHSLLRKGAHVAEFAVFAVLVYRAVSLCGWAWRRTTARRTAALALAWAAFDELHQLFIQGRTAAVPDVLLDAAGVGLGLAAVWMVSRMPGNLPARPAEAASEPV